MFSELAPPVVFPCADVLHVVLLLLKLSFLNGGVLVGILVTHGFMGSTLTLKWIGFFPSIPTLGPLVFLSYVAPGISSIYSTTRRSATSSSSLDKPSLTAMTLFFVFTLYW
jgi:hypothetical protein